MYSLWVFVPLVSAVCASFNNLNYRSPSHNHPELGLSLSKIAKRDVTARQIQPSKLNFTHGVASGDPHPDSVILWTRVAPKMDNDHSNVTVSGYVPLYDHGTTQYTKASTAPVCVHWKVGTDSNLDRVVSRGTAHTTSDIDYTIKASYSSSCLAL